VAVGNEDITSDFFFFFKLKSTAAAGEIATELSGHHQSRLYLLLAAQQYPHLLHGMRKNSGVVPIALL
jgi:hypothetical protein